jgi:hypothetical protein
MPMNQLHADRTARIKSEQRLLNLPHLRLPRLARREASRAATTLAPTC